MMSRYRLKAPIRAILDKPGTTHVSVTIPAGAVLYESSQPSSTLFGMVGMLWEGRHYSVFPTEVINKAERVSTA